MVEESKKAQDAGQETDQQVTQPEAEQPQVDESAQEAVASEDEWRKALETAVKQRDDYLAMAQRTQADFANFKRRNAQSRTDGYDEGVRDVLTALLPTLDNLDRAIEAAEKQDAQSALLEGVKMTRKLLLEAGAKLGLEEVEALGAVFDPEKHNAVMRAEEGEPGTVLEVFQKGYRVKDRIIRYAMVKVAVS